MKKKKYMSIGLVLWTCILCFIPVAAADEAIKILIFPFSIDSQRDLSFLEPAVMDMLYTRLAGQNRMIVLENAATVGGITGQTAILAGIQKQADFAVIGNLVFTADTVSTDARFLDIASKKSLVIFRRFGISQGALIEHIDLFTIRINEEVFGQVLSITPIPSAATDRDDVYINPEEMEIPDIVPPAAPSKRKKPKPVVSER